MKTTCYFSLAMLIFLCACQSETTTKGKAVFGIHEVIAINEIPNPILDTLRSRNIQMESIPQQSVICCITKADTMVLQTGRLSGYDVSLTMTQYPFDKDQKYYAVVALRPNPAIDNTHIKKVRATGNKIEIFFNHKGAQKWAELTGKSIGKQVAFVIDNHIYAMPVVNAEIRNGMAMINGLASETDAMNISASLNQGK